MTSVSSVNHSLGEARGVGDKHDWVKSALTGRHAVVEERPMLGLCTPCCAVEEALRSSSLSLDVRRASMARAIQIVARDYTNRIWMFHRVSAPGEL